MEATISDCGKFRFTLKRKLGDYNIKPCLFIMLNPSTADAKVNDPTIKKCMYYAAREKCTSLTVVNLFPLRATDPKELAGNERLAEYENMNHIVEQIKAHEFGLVVLAWGSHKATNHYIKEWVLTQLFWAKVLPKCLTINDDGNPRHPLYVPKDQALIDFPLQKKERPQ